MPIICGGRNLSGGLVSGHREGPAYAAATGTHSDAVIPNDLLGNLLARCRQLCSTTGNDVRAGGREIDVQFAVLNPIGGTVVSGRHQNGYAQRSRVLKYLVHLLTRLRTPTLFGRAPTDRDHGRLIYLVVDRGADRINKTTISVRRVIHRDFRIGSY
jgi:hypothetical protein